MFASHFNSAFFLIVYSDEFLKNMYTQVTNTLLKYKTIPSPHKVPSVPFQSIAPPHVLLPELILAVFILHTC